MAGRPGCCGAEALRSARCPDSCRRREPLRDTASVRKRRFHLPRPGGPSAAALRGAAALGPGALVVATDTADREGAAEAEESTREGELVRGNVRTLRGSGKASSLPPGTQTGVRGEEPGGARGAAKRKKRRRRAGSRSRRRAGGAGLAASSGSCGPS
ncbi:hypothetical protein Nmel_004137 [Mimus melanotis]